MVDCHHAQKPENCPISDFFDLTPKYFLPLLPYTDLAPPSTDPVPTSTNQYRPKLTIMYEPLPPSTDPVTSSANRNRLLLTQYHHISTSTTPYWPSTTKYQPVPTYTVVAWGLQTSAQFTLGLVLKKYQWRLLNGDVQFDLSLRWAIPKYL